MSLFKSKFLKSENILKNIYYILMTNIKPVVNLYWLQNAAQQISENKLTVADAAKNAHFNLNQYLYINPISPATLRKLFAEYNITYYTQKGRKPFEMTEEIENLILYFQSYLNSGEKVTFYSIILEYPNIPFIAVRQTFIKFHLYKYKKPQKKEKPRCRYEAKFCNQIWHADIHYYQKDNMESVQYLYAIMDDKSRFIVGYGLLNKKNCEQCIKILSETIDKYGAPSIMWTDNGGENTGQKMLKFLKEKRIYPVTTEPYNPQQNGKIERFWQKLEDSTSSSEEIPDYIFRYNMIRAHMALIDNNLRRRPVDVYFNENLRWKRDYPWEWFVDGKQKVFPFNEEKKKFYYD